jgi:hypothetical protein
MDGWTIGADIGAMLTGLSVLTATIVWTRTQWRDWRYRKAQVNQQNWHGYIMLGMISDWSVRLAEDPQEATARVVLDVLDNRGNPDINGAQNLGQRIASDGMIARVPTPEEYAFLKALHKERRYGQGFPVGISE